MIASRRGITVAAAVGALLPQWWMRPGAVVAAGDTGLPLFTLRGITSFWGDQFAGTGSTGYPSAMLLERGVVRAVDLLGGSPSLGQRCWFTIVFAVAAASVAWMAAAFVRHPAAVATAGVAAVINPFHIHSLPNMLPLVCLACMAIAVGTCARWWLGRQVSPLVGVALGLWAAELARNPPLFVLFAAVAGTSVVAVLVAGRQRRAVVVTLAWCVTASLFWIVPLALHFLGGTAGLEVVAATGSDWEWTQRHSGPFAVVTFTAAWVWGDPDVLTATATLSQGVWLWLRWALPVLVLTALVVARRRRVVKWLAALIALLAVVSTGVNAPFGPINRFLADTVPGFWLFRQPSSKFGVPLLLCTSLVLAIGVDALLARRSSPVVRRTSPVIVALAVAAIAFSHPLLTGSVIPGDRSYLPSSEVVIPSSLLDAGRALDAAPGFGTTLVLPLSEYYQRGTVWGYYGVDDVIGRVSSRPALYVLPEGYYEPAGAAPEMMQVAESALLVGDRRAFVGAMESLGTSLLAIRLDVTPAYGRDRRFADSTALDAAAAAMGLPVLDSTDTVRIYSVPTATRFSAATSAWSVAAAEGEDVDEARATAAVVAGEQIVLDDEGVPAVAWVPRAGSTSVEVDLPDGPAAATAVVQGPLVWRAVATGDGVSVELASGATVDGREVVTAAAAPSVAVEGVADGVAGVTGVAALIVRDELLPLGDDTVLQANGGEALRVLVDERARPIELADAMVTGCGDDAELSSAAAPVTNGVRLVADAAHPCVEVAVELPEPSTSGRVWHLRAEFRSSQDAAVEVCWWLPSLGRCAPGTHLRPTGTSGTIDLLTDVHTDDLAGARLVLSAVHDGTSGEPVRVTWRDVSLQPLTETDAPLVLPRVIVPWTEVEVGADTQLGVATPVAALLGDPTRSVGDCNNYDDRPTQLSVEFTGSGEASAEGPPAVTLRADRHSACVWLPIDRPVAVGAVELAFRYRSGDDRAARYAIVDDVTGDTLATASLPAATEWTPVELAVELPAAMSSRSGRARLYLYADGPGPGERADFVAAEYSDIHLAPRPPISLVVVADEVPADMADDGTGAENRPTITDEGVRRATLPAGSHSVTIVFHEAYAPGWSLSGLPEGASARHVRVDGWANGWVVDGLGGRAATIEVSYRWETVVAVAVWSVLPVLVVALIVALYPVVRRRRERTSPCATTPTD